jgi:DNA-binding transcriptional ArsR family regulator
MLKEAKTSSPPLLADESTMTSLQSIRVLFHPHRLQIVELLEGEPRTVKQIASQLKIGPTRLYYHIKLLAEHGFIRVVKTRVVSGIIEKQYQATAHRFIVDRALYFVDGSRHGALDVLLSSIWDETKRDIKHSAKDGCIDLSQKAPMPTALMLRRELRRMPATRAQAFYARLTALFREFDCIDSDAYGADVALYALTLAFYPSLSQPTTLPDRKRKARAGRRA